MNDNAEPPECIDMLGSRIERVARLGMAEEDAVLFRMRMAPGQFAPLHSHSDPESFYVLSGRLDAFLVDGGWRTITAGHSILMAGGVDHAIRNPGDAPTDIVLATNGRMARFYREAGKPVTAGDPPVPPGPADFERVARAASSFGYRLYPPAESNRLTGVPPLGGT